MKPRPYKLPDFLIYPSFRVNKPNYPLENCGMDMLGPVQHRGDTVYVEKCWILLWTCLSCRAIVVDVIQNMPSNTFLHSLRHFIATNGCPKLIISDNATTFKAFSTAQATEPVEIQNDEHVLDYCANQKIQFKYIPAFSPWQGGVNERMIGIFKSAFKNAIGSRILPLETLITIAKESEAICNSRPQTYVTDEVDHIPLRPIDFTRPTSRLASPRFLEDDDEWKPSHKTRDDLIKDWKFGLDILNQQLKFWNKWSNEYLTCLRERHQGSHTHPRSFQKGQPKCGDYVLIQEKDQKRGTWKIGQIRDSSDNYTRSVQVKLPSKRTITRPINLICPFEII
ncbi:unnamed protein product [Nippostrongylus brasiliensis]|uniref:Integrase catalytic domain-containing protein n=1 Tax=Nippostrongylus brasiliensis TaxID=27835 RepID=A0A0N4YU98_NIPBR|nr:unnamed protein product [Nippostrongylus brasiliensis]